MRWTTVPLRCVGAALGLAACVTGAAADRDTTITDSAGVAIAVATGLDRPAQLALTELFRLGGADEGPGSFTGAWPTTVGTDAAGRIYVLDGRQFRVEVFDAEGRHLRFLGARGAGPGEFRFAGQLHVHPSGEVGVVDFSKRAVVRWSPDGEVLPEIRIQGFTPVDPIMIRGDTLVHVRVTTDGRVRTQRLRIVTPSDTTDLPGLESPTSGMIMFSCVGLDLPPLFNRELVWGSDGRRIAVSHQVPYQVDLYERGRLVRSVRRSMTPEAAGMSHVERLYPEGFQITVAGGLCTVPAAELVEKQGIAEHLPLLNAVTIGPSGRLWAERYAIGDDPRKVDLFDAEGRYLGTLDGRPLPLGFIGGDVVLFPEEDRDTGITRLVAYRMSGGD